MDLGSPILNATGLKIFTERNIPEEGYLSGRREKDVYKNKMEQIWQMFNINKKVS